MDSKLIKSLCISFIVFFSVFFVNVDNAKAEVANNTGKAKCTYSFTINSNNLKAKITVAKSGSSPLATDCEIEGNGSEGYKCSVNNTTKLADALHQRSTNVYQCPTLYIEQLSTSHPPTIPGATTTVTQYTYSLTPNSSEATQDAKANSGGPLSLDDADVENGNDISNSDDQFSDYGNSKNVLNSGEADLEGIRKWARVAKPEGPGYQYGNCNLIPTSIIDFLSTLFTVLSIVGVVLLVIMSAIEFIKAVTGSEEDGVKSALKHTLIRIICVVVLLLLPQIITFILNVVNNNNYVIEDNKVVIGDNGDPLCKVVK